MAFKFCGLADEAGKTMAEQIAATKELGWSGIEIRMLEGKNLCEHEDAVFYRAWDQMRAAGLCIPSFSSAIANWSRPIDGDFKLDQDELRRCLPRMQRTGTRIIRCMSYPNAKEPWSDGAWRKEVVRRLKVLARMAEEAGVILGHENCLSYGGLGPRQFLELVDGVDSPAFKLIFDTGNQTTHLQSGTATWEYYEKTRAYICHVHIKAAKLNQEGKYVTCFPDEDPVQARILRDLHSRGYREWVSIEPHLQAVPHLRQDVSDANRARQVYVEFGRRLMRMCAEITGDRSWLKAPAFQGELL